ncbi:MAG TPA: ABC transporter ATP-binding protein [Candidatus Scatomonas merdavium]|nr:ABC transporter ATP-binding protein [Candidatus Scatomonas merdavium]
MTDTEKKISADTPVLSIRHLNKTMGKRQILKDISFSCYPGEVFGFLGPNGAGKTTTIKVVCGLLAIDSGDIEICGNSIRKHYERAMAYLGAIVENPEHYRHMSGWQNLKLYQNMRPGITDERIREVVSLVGLENRIQEPVRKYSLGMRQRLGVAQALLHRPKLLILDEPTNGLDPAGIRQLRDILKEIAHREGAAVLVSSHLMSEMELMCDRVGLIVNGEIRDVKPIGGLIEEAYDGSTAFLYRVDQAETAVQLLREKYPDIAASLVTEHEFSVRLKPSSEPDSAGTPLHQELAAYNSFLIQSGITLYTVAETQDHTLEDAFIRLTDEGGNQIV